MKRVYDDNGRVCWKCNVYKLHNEFINERSRYCNECRLQKPGVSNEDYYVVVRLAAYKQRAEDRGLEFNLTAEDIIQSELCMACDKPIRYPNLDRLNNSLGYVKGNVYWICARHNMLKSNGILEEFEVIVSYMKKYKKS